MNLIEVFVTRDALTAAERAALGRRMVNALIDAPGAPDEVVQRGRSLTRVAFHETEPAGEPATGMPPLYTVRLTVPGGHLDDGMRTEIVRRLTAALADHHGDHEWFLEQPNAWFHIVEVPDGSEGAFGRTLGVGEIVQYVVNGQLNREGVGPGVEQADLVVTDPICGMTVDLSATDLSLDLDGVTYGFCSRACLDLFKRRHGVAA